MAYFAKLNSENIVVQVVSINNQVLLDNGIELESKGIEFCKSLFGQDTIWKQTSYNSFMGKYYNTDRTLGDQSKCFRKNYASKGYTYDEQRDAFIQPKMFDSWILDEDTCFWVPPIPYPPDRYKYRWNEEIKNWEEIII